MGNLGILLIGILIFDSTLLFLKLGNLQSTGQCKITLILSGRGQTSNGHLSPMLQIGERI